MTKNENSNENKRTSLYLTQWREIYQKGNIFSEERENRTKIEIAMRTKTQLAIDTVMQSHICPMYDARIDRELTAALKYLNTLDDIEYRHARDEIKRRLDEYYKEGGGAEHDAAVLRG